MKIAAIVSYDCICCYRTFECETPFMKMEYLSKTGASYLGLIYFILTFLSKRFILDYPSHNFKLLDDK